METEAPVFLAEIASFNRRDAGGMERASHQSMNLTKDGPCQKDVVPRGKRHFLRSLLLAAATVVVLPGAAASQRVVNDADTVRIPGNVSPRLSGAVDVGRTDGTLPVEKMILVLQPPAGASDQLARLLDEQLDPASANYHRWLTPEEYGLQFGVQDDDLNTVLGWLQRNGFTIDGVAKGRGWINFSGTTEQVETTFRTEMRDFVVDGRLHRANARDPQVPRALQNVVGGVVSLHDFFKLSRPHRRPAIAFTDGTQGLGPADFATIYNTAPLLAAGIDGSGQTIAVVARTNIKVADVREFRTFFGLPALDPVITLNGPDPGILGGNNGDEGEADLDVEWAGAVAPGATINLVVSKSTALSDGVDLSAQYIVDHNLGPVLTMSYAACESDMGTSGLQFYNALWQQAAAQGMSVSVASGDSGAAGCDASDALAGIGRGVNGLSSTPYNVSVGGTQFVDGTSSQYWNTSSAPGTYRSVKSYIPEQAWNESASVTGGSGLWATGGGPSVHFTKPSWQSAPGVPSDGFRDIPDISLNAASGVGYVTFTEYVPGSNLLYVSGGTSASAQCFGGIMALVNQKSGGGRQGNPNPVLYRLAAAQYSGSGPAIFHDVTAGNNGVPGVAGFSAGPGYDLVTGIGSVDVQALASDFGGTASSPALAVAIGPSSVSFTAGSSGSVNVTTTGSGGFSAAVSLSVSGLPVGVTGTFVPQNLPAPGSGSATLGLSSSASTVPGTYAATVMASGGGLSHTAMLSVTISSLPPPSITFFTANPVVIAQGQSSTLSWASNGSTSASIGSGVGSVPTSGSVTVSPAQTTTYALSVVGPGGALSAAVTVSVSDSVFSVSRLVPIVLNAAGLGAARYSTELTLANRGTLPAGIQLAYTAASALSAAGSGTVQTTLGPGRQLVIPDTIAYLGAHGLLIPTDGSSQGGALLVTFSGLSSDTAAFASARTTTPSGSGHAGLSYASARVDDVNVKSGVQTGTSWLYGLREIAADRTNLALVNSSTDSAITLGVTLFDGSGTGSYRLSPDISLGPGQWTQMSRVLTQAGFSTGYARIDLLSGSGPYYDYAVFNDNATNDGSFIPPDSDSSPTEALLLPVLVETSVYQSELVLTNSSAAPQTATLVYTESLTPALGSGGSLAVTLAAGEQRIIPSAIDFLRQQGAAIGPMGAASYAGSLSVQFQTGGAPSSGFAGARTSAPAQGGGEYGVFYPAFRVSESATTEAWVFGLQETSSVRSNLAVVNMGNVGGALTFHLEVYDGDTGQLAGQSTDLTLGPHAWLQLNDVLQGYGASNGFARVVATAGTDRFIAYGVVNDGATPTSGATNDGSFLAFCNR